MATIRQRSSGSWEVIIRHKSLPKPYYATLDTEAEARGYARKLEARIKAGDIPKALLEVPERTVGGLIRRYQVGASISVHDLSLLDRLGVDAVRADTLTVQWALAWVSSMQATGIAPGTIRKKVGALARCLDWCKLAGLVEGNPVRELPRNYASYPVGHVKRREDVERDRRLLPDEEERLRKVLTGRHDWLLLFELALETAMRLREMFTLEWAQVDLDKRTFFLEKTKNGDRRQVPMSSVIHGLIPSRVGKFPVNPNIGDNQSEVVRLSNIPSINPDRSNPSKAVLVFPWWDGDQRTLAKTTARLSHQWSRIARDAGCVDLRFHDLRHEATCRLYERTTLGDVQIARITGHKSLLMLKRYANLRGSDLADSLW